MSDRPRIYLDNAASSWPKPEAVYRDRRNARVNLWANEVSR